MTTHIGAGESDGRGVNINAELARFAEIGLTQEGFATNAEVSIDVLRQPAFRIPASATSGLQRMVDAGQLSTRAYGTILRLAWTVSDLRGAGRPDKEAVATAVELYHPRRHTD